MKILIMGYSGSGKSTLAGYLGKKYGIPVLHLDHVFWLPGWKARPREEMGKMVARFMEEHDSWVIDGNYTKTEYERRLQEADRIVILMFNRFFCLYRVWKRYRKYKGRTRRDMGRGCTEKLDREFVWWLLWEGRTRERRRESERVRRQYKGKVMVVRNQKELNRIYRKGGCKTRRAVSK